MNLRYQKNIIFLLPLNLPQNLPQ
jgi:hypothetical protein